MKISVTVCTYNAEKFLEQQLVSIIEQSLEVDEIVICDDKSFDSTEIIIQSFIIKYPHQFRFFKNEKTLGPVKNFEKCIGLSTGDIIFLADQDDIWLKNKVERMLDNFKNDTQALLFFSNGNLIDEDNNYIGSTLWDKWSFNDEVKQNWLDNKKAFLSLLNGINMITGATVAFKKELKENMFPFDLPFLYYHDTWLGLLASGNNGLRFIDECLILYRVHPSQQVGIGNGVALNNKNHLNLGCSNINIKQFHINVFKIFPQFKPTHTDYLIRKLKNHLRF